MTPRAHYDPFKTFKTTAQSPFYAAERFLYANDALNGDIIEEWDVRGAGGTGAP